MSTRGTVILFVLLFIIPVSMFSQVDTTATLDTTRAVPFISDVPISAESTKTIHNFESTKKPWLAVGLSAAVPGLGQIYNEDYWHVPVILGLGGYWVYEWRKLNDKYQDFRRQYNESVSLNAPDAKKLESRDFYRDERDKFAWFLGGLYFLNLVDAYVGANLYDFSVSPDLSADGKVVPRVTASIRIRF